MNECDMNENVGAGKLTLSKISAKHLRNDRRVVLRTPIDAIV